MNEHYGSLEGGTEYFKGSMDSDPWDCALDSLRLKALITATRSIDKLNFVSQKEDSSQELAFPRTAQTGVIPVRIIYATYELARALLDGVDDQLEFDNLNVAATSFSGVRTSYKQEGSLDHIICGIPDIKAWRLLLPYLRDDKEINLIRV